MARVSDGGPFLGAAVEIIENAELALVEAFFRWARAFLVDGTPINALRHMCWWCCLDSLDARASIRVLCRACSIAGVEVSGARVRP